MGDTSVSPLFRGKQMEIKIEKNIPIPNNNPSIFKRKGASPWGVLSTMKVGDSFLLESNGDDDDAKRVEMQMRAIRSWVYAQRKFKGVRIRILQRKLYFEFGRVAFRIWRVSDV
jgi:hypothetical protein